MFHVSGPQYEYVNIFGFLQLTVHFIFRVENGV